MAEYKDEFDRVIKAEELTTDQLKNLLLQDVKTKTKQEADSELRAAENAKIVDKLTQLINKVAGQDIKSEINKISNLLEKLKVEEVVKGLDKVTGAVEELSQKMAESFGKMPSFREDLIIESMENLKTVFEAQHKTFDTTNLEKTMKMDSALGKEGTKAIMHLEELGSKKGSIQTHDALNEDIMKVLDEIKKIQEELLKIGPKQTAGTVAAQLENFFIDKQISELGNLLDEQINEIRKLKMEKTEKILGEKLELEEVKKIFLRVPAEATIFYDEMKDKLSTIWEKIKPEEEIIKETKNDWKQLKNSWYVFGNNLKQLFQMKEPSVPLTPPITEKEFLANQKIEELIFQDALKNLSEILKTPQKKIEELTPNMSKNVLELGETPKGQKGFVENIITPKENTVEKKIIPDDLCKCICDCIENLQKNSNMTTNKHHKENTKFNTLIKKHWNKFLRENKINNKKSHGLFEDFNGYLEDSYDVGIDENNLTEQLIKKTRGSGGDEYNISRLRGTIARLFSASAEIVKGDPIEVLKSMRFELAVAAAILARSVFKLGGFLVEFAGIFTQKIGDGIMVLGRLTGIILVKFTKGLTKLTGTILINLTQGLIKAVTHPIMFMEAVWNKAIVGTSKNLYTGILVAITKTKEIYKTIKDTGVSLATAVKNIYKNFTKIDFSSMFKNFTTAIGDTIGFGVKGIGKLIGMIGGAIAGIIGAGAAKLAEFLTATLLQPITEELQYFQDLRETAFETRGLGAGTGAGQESLEDLNPVTKKIYESMPEVGRKLVDIANAKDSSVIIQQMATALDDVLQTGQTISTVQKEQIKNMKRGINEVKGTNKVYVTGLNTARLIGANAEQTSEMFSDWHQNLRLSTTQLADMGRGLRGIALSSGVTGDNLIKVARNSEQFMKNMQNAGTFSTAAGKNIVNLLAEASKTGSTESVQNLLGVLSGSILDPGGNQQIKNLAIVATKGQAHLMDKLLGGTLLRDKKALGQFTQGLKGVLLEQTGPGGIEKLSPERRGIISTIMKQVYGIGLNELQSLIDTLDAPTKTFVQRMEEAEKIVLKQERNYKMQELTISQGLEYLDIFNSKLKETGGNFDTANTAFRGSKDILPETLKKLGVKGLAGGKELAGGLIEEVTKNLNQRIVDLKLGKELIIGPDEIKKALAGGQKGVEGLLVKINAVNNQVNIAQKDLSNPMSRAARSLQQIETMFRVLISGYLAEYQPIIDAILDGFEPAMKEFREGNLMEGLEKVWNSGVWGSAIKDTLVGIEKAGMIETKINKAKAKGTLKEEGFGKGLKEDFKLTGIQEEIKGVLNWLETQVGAKLSELTTINPFEFVITAVANYFEKKMGEATDAIYDEIMNLPLMKKFFGESVGTTAQKNLQKIEKEEPAMRAAHQAKIEKLSIEKLKEEIVAQQKGFEEQEGIINAIKKTIKETKKLESGWGDWFSTSKIPELKDQLKQKTKESSIYRTSLENTRKQLEQLEQLKTEKTMAAEMTKVIPPEILADIRKFEKEMVNLLLPMYNSTMRVNNFKKALEDTNLSEKNRIDLIERRDAAITKQNKLFNEFGELKRTELIELTKRKLKEELPRDIFAKEIEKFTTQWAKIPIDAKDFNEQFDNLNNEFIKLIPHLDQIRKLALQEWKTRFEIANLDKEILDLREKLIGTLISTNKDFIMKKVSATNPEEAMNKLKAMPFADLRKLVEEGKTTGDMTLSTQLLEKVDKTLQELTKLSAGLTTTKSPIPPKQEGTFQVETGGLARLHAGEAIVPAHLRSMLTPITDTGPFPMPPEPPSITSLSTLIDNIAESMNRATFQIKEEERKVPEIQPTMPIATDPEQEIKRRRLNKTNQETTDLETIEENTGVTNDKLEKVSKLLEQIRGLLAPRKGRKGSKDSGESINEEPFFDPQLSTEWQDGRFGDVVGLDIGYTESY